ncbi:MAG: YicC family protein [Oscillospiraceae bacterium]|nr:YicC family protein [Oscillospiraceae bacterium]MBQ9981337.1 YicC family protein [Oscillospiraceae bacterium]
MIRSMTGYGRERELVNGRDILVEIKSVNHRYNEYYVKVPRAYSYLEEPLKKLVQENISRGKVEISVTIINVSASDTKIEVDTALASEYINAMRKANMELGLMDDLSLSRIMRFQDIFTVTKAVDDTDAVWNDVKVVAQKAVAGFLSMREAEGEKLRDDISGRLDVVEKMVYDIEKAAPEMTKLYMDKLYSRLSELLADQSVDQQRILTEAAIFSEKTAVDEETVRLSSHISQFRSLLETENIVGRKLDFIIQEMNREANTIGSKVQSLDITKVVIDIKSEIEKIREQVQNIE